MSTPLHIREDDPALPLALSHTADRLRCYAGEEITLHTRLDVRAAVQQPVLEIELPPATEIVDYSATTTMEATLAVTPAGRFAIWRGTWLFQAGEQHHFTLCLRLRRDDPLQTVIEDAEDYQRNTWLTSRAEMRANLAKGGAQVRAADTVMVAVFAKSQYLQYLPALYERDQFMARFLMLFESFWAPIHQQIDAMHAYFDPYLTPPQLLPWLAYWLGLTLHEQWPEARQRRLLASAVRLYRTRGTRAGLTEMLEIFTGGQVEIQEHRADNFRLGRGAHLGQGIAIGQRNRPFSFSVRVHLPAARDANAQRQQMSLLHTIIDAEKPAHTTYTLDVVELAPTHEQL